jgi:predicted AlkP superfamily phosphohydrolase/phosphomutase
MGIVEEGEEYEKIREFLMERIKNIPDPQTGKPIVSRIFKKEEIYPGTLNPNAPDIVFFLEDMKILATPVLGMGNGLFFDPFWPGLAYHRMDGIFLASGANIRKGGIVSDARLIDMMPTILYALGVPIPKGLDGKALTHIFTKSFQTSTPARYVEPDSGDNNPEDDIPVLTEEENIKVRQALKDLGYL